MTHPSSTLQETWTSSRPETLALSNHLKIVNGHRNQPAAYHQLFGNLTVIDRELAHFLSAHTGLTWSRSTLLDRIGQDAFDTLWSSYFLVRSGFEERELIANLLAEREAGLSSGSLVGALQISGSNLCNFACSYCFADSSDARSTRRQEIAAIEQNVSLEIASEAIRKVLKLALSHKKEGIAVKFLGREPLINWPVMRHLFSEFAGAPVQWSVTTNGTLLTPVIAEELARYDVSTIVSLDGPASMNDVFRVFKSGKGTHESITRRIEFLKSANAPFSVSSVLSLASNLSSLKEFTEQVACWNALYLQFTLVMQTDLVQLQRANPDPRALVDNLVDLYEHGSKYLPIYGDCFDPFHQIRTTHKFRDEIQVSRPLGASCSASSHQLSLEPTGDLFPCRAMSTHYGSISNLDSALRSSDYRKVAMRTYWNVAACRDCSLEGMCQGTCLGASEQTGDVYSVKPEYCDIYKSVTRRLLERWCESQFYQSTNSQDEVIQ